MPMIADVAPDRATYQPGDAAQVRVTLVNHAPTPFMGTLTLHLMHLDQVIECVQQSVRLAAASTTHCNVALTLPPTTLRGYGLDVWLSDADGQECATGSGALDVLEHWSQAPRYGFLSDFALGERDVAARCDSLCRNHLNVVQFYDWMWRHYQLLPPTDEFTDALGRQLSLATVRTMIEAVHTRGGAALAYGAVYGAEPEFANQHLDLALYDEHGQRISLAELFYIMNIAPDSPWVPLIVAEFASVVRALPFDGIHLDQYGFPRTARTARGEIVDLADHFPPLIDAARAAVVAERPDAGVIFNAVENWPIATVAPTTQDVVYIEVWPPYLSYNDLRDLIREGKRLSGGKAMILAAYLTPFATADATSLPQAEAAALLITATIAASGGSHLLLGERDGILCDPYYPKYATLRPAFAAHMHAYYDFLVRYEEWLIAPDVQPWEFDDVQVACNRPIHFSRDAQAGHVWVIGAQKPGYCIMHVINLTDQQDVAWNALHTPPTPLEQCRLTIRGLRAVDHVLVLTPDTSAAQPQRAQMQQVGNQTVILLPELRVWTVLVAVLTNAG